MADGDAVGGEDGDAAVALRRPGRQADVLGEELLQVFRVVRHLAVEHRLARCAGDRNLEVVHRTRRPPHRQGTKAAAVRRQSRDERVAHAERDGEMLHERAEEAVADLRLDPLDDGAQGPVIIERVAHGAPV